jgi:hypothetical protein
LTFNEASSIEQYLKPFYHGGDKDEEKKIKEVFFDKLVTLIHNLAAKKQKFGNFLKSLSLPDDECYLLFSSIDPNENLEETAEQEEQSVDFDSLFSDDDASGDSKAGTGDQFARITHDIAYRFRLRLEQAWLSRLDQLATDDHNLRYLEMDRQSCQNMVQEIIQGARRLGVMTNIENQLRKTSSYGNVNPERLLWQQARIASVILGDFISFLGLSPALLTTEQRRVTVKNRQSVVFEPPAMEGAFPVLAESQPNYDFAYFRDWLASFYRLMMHNVDFSEASYDIEENSRLGAILNKNNTAKELCK